MSRQPAAVTRSTLVPAMAFRMSIVACLLLVGSHLGVAGWGRQEGHGIHGVFRAGSRRSNVQPGNQDPRPPEVIELLAKVATSLDAGHPQKALELLQRSNLLVLGATPARPLNSASLPAKSDVGWLFIGDRLAFKHQPSGKQSMAPPNPERVALPGLRRKSNRS